MVLGKLPVLGCPTNLDKCRARAYCACSRCGWGLFLLKSFYSSLKKSTLPATAVRFFTLTSNLHSDVIF